jgi:hypothetical protein
MDSRESLLKGGDQGPAIVPGKPDESLLIQAVRHLRDDLLMPMGGDKLTEQQIADLTHWIEIDAPWPDVKSVAALSPEPDARTEEEKGFWSFRPLARPDVPTPRDLEWAKTDIDRFVKAKLESEGLEPVSPASRRNLIRRVSFDLTGLPPTPEEIDAFVNDESSDAFEKVVDRLLASPHYGEFWGRHWLDVARYGEDDTRGLAEDGGGREVYGSAYVYRDWVIQSLNDDMPYDLFVKSQLAGDLLERISSRRPSGASAFSAAARGTTTSQTRPSPARTSATTGWTSSAADFSVSPWLALDATTTSSIPSPPRTTTRSLESSTTPAITSTRLSRIWRPPSTRSRKSISMA